MNRTPIEWCRTYAEDGSFTEGWSVNPVRFIPHGSDRAVTMCQKVSPGCKNCYAESITRRFWPKHGLVRVDELGQKWPHEEFPGYTALGISGQVGLFFLDENKLLAVLRHRAPGKVFWGDMTDLFGEWVSDEWLDKMMVVCALTPHLTHIFLTKRAGRMREYFTKLRPNNMSNPHCGETAWYVWRQVTQLQGSVRRETHCPMGWEIDTNEDHRPIKGWPLLNLVLMVSVENQEQADTRIPELIQTPAAVRGISAEPLLGPLDLLKMLHLLDWVIVGGESGAGMGIRMMQAVWAQSLRDQCIETDTAFFFKQWGAFLPDRQNTAMKQDPAPPSFGGIRFGKKAAGNLLDGKQWHQFPEVSNA